MQIVSYIENIDDKPVNKIGFLVETKIYECRAVDPNLPATKYELFRKWDRYKKLAELTYNGIKNNWIKHPLHAVRVTDVENPEIIDLNFYN